MKATRTMPVAPMTVAPAAPNPKAQLRTGGKVEETPPPATCGRWMMLSSCPMYLVANSPCRSNPCPPLHRKSNRHFSAGPEYYYFYACVNILKFTALKHARTHTRTHALSLSLSLSHTHTHTHTHARTHRRKCMVISMLDLNSFYVVGSVIQFTTHTHTHTHTHIFFFLVISLFK